MLALANRLRDRWGWHIDRRDPPAVSANWPALAAMLLAAAMPEYARAGIHCVRPGGGAPCLSTISAALTAAGVGDTIRVAAGTYAEDLVIDKNVILEGGWDPTFTSRDPATQITTIQPATLDGSVISINGVFGDTAQSTPTIEGFTITGGRADLGFNHGGGLTVRNSDAVIRNNTISNNRAYLLGGGVWVQNGAPLLEGNRIENNRVEDVGGLGLGGGVQLEGTQAILRDNLIATNSVVGSGDGWGGGVHVGGGGPVLLAGNTIRSNQAHVPTVVPGSFGRGSGLATGGATVTVRGGAISENLIVDSGGGVYTSGGSLVVEGVQLLMNSAKDGGALRVDSASYAIRNSLLALNEVTTDAPVVHLAGTSSGSIINCTLVGDGSGVGSVIDVAIRADPTASLDLTNAIVQGFHTGVDGATGGNVNNFWDVVTEGDTASLNATYNLNPLLDQSYHLTAGSPMIDFAFQTLFAHDFDIDGEPRRMKGPSGLFQLDLGADEFTGPGQRLLLPMLRPDDADLTIIGPGYPAANPDSDGSNDWIGFAVLGEDIDGDGADDLVISAQDWAEDFATLNATGRLFGLSNFGFRRTGNIDLLATPADLLVVGQRENQHLGQELAGGDLDGDGASDLVIGSGVQTDGDPTIVSTVVMLAGGPGLGGEVQLGPDPLGDFSLLAQDGAGTALGDRNALALGDINGDGRPDLVAGDPSADDGASADAGAVFVIFGRTGLSGEHDLAATAADFTVRGPGSNAFLGKLALGYLDGGTQLDLAVRSANAAYGFFGPLASGEHRLATTAADVVVSGLDGDGVSERVALIDVTGDGRQDLVTTSTDDMANPVLLVFAGPFTLGQSLTEADAERSLLVAFPTLAVADVERDPRPELIIGAAGIKTVWVVPPGSLASPDLYAVASTIILGEGDGFKNFGWDIAAGDLDHDQRDDLIVSTWQVVDPDNPDAGKADVGKAFVFYSPPPPPPEIFADSFESGD